jgi:hypothetical protein
MIEFNLTLLRVKCQKEKRNPLWGHVESCWLRSKAAEYHLSAIKRKLEEVKDWPKQENQIFYVLDIELEIGYEVDALMLKLHSLLDITAQVIGVAMNYEFETKEFWKELKQKGIPSNFSSLIKTYRSDRKWQTIVSYSNVTKHVKNVGGTLHLYYGERDTITKFKTDPVQNRQLPVLDICEFKELINFAEDFVKETLTLITMHLWPNSKEDFDTPSSSRCISS